MPDGFNRPRVPAEHLGQARLFRNRVKALDTETERALAAIIKPLRARLAKHPKLRTEQIAATLRTYALTVPTELSIGGPVSIVHDRSEFALGEVRLISSWLHASHWTGGDPTEAGIAVARFLLKLHAGRLRAIWEPIAVVSLHALARRVERSERRDHAAIYADLAPLARADAAAEMVAVADGFWVGKVAPMHGLGPVLSVRNVRTWHQ